MGTLKHIRAIFLLPFMVTIVIPLVLTVLAGGLDIGWSLSPPLNLLPIALGICLIAVGLALMIQTVSLFASVGQGTLAPWDPPQRLVVRGPYRRVRNPMIVGVFCIVLGEAALMGSVPILCWFVAMVAVNFLYMPLVEEPGLVRRFGDGYLTYKKNVPAWIPRISPWGPPEETGHNGE